MADQKELPEKFKAEELDSLFPESKITDTAQLAAVASGNAADYLYAGIILSEHINVKSGVSSACAVVAAFSCELYLKSIIYSTGKNRITGHSLEELFNEVPTNIRNEILNKVEQYDPQNYFMTGLRDNGDAFTKVRYLFERERIRFSPSFLLSFAQILRDYIALKG